MLASSQCQPKKELLTQTHTNCRIPYLYCSFLLVQMEELISFKCESFCNFNKRDGFAYFQVFSMLIRWETSRQHQRYVTYKYKLNSIPFFLVGEYFILSEHMHINQSSFFFFFFFHSLLRFFLISLSLL